MKYFLNLGSKVLRMNMISGIRLPLSMHLWLTNRCPNNCTYCHIHQLPQKDYWSTDGLKKVMSEMRDCGTRRIHFTGGEPLLRKDIAEVVAHAKEMGFFTSMITSGYKVAERFDELKGLDVVYLSYDGFFEGQNNLRRGTSACDIERTLKSLKDADIPVWTVTVLNRQNMEYIEDIVAFVGKYNAVANFSMLNFTSTPEEHFRPSLSRIQELLMTGDERRECLRKLIKMKSLGCPVGSSFAYLQNALEWQYDDRVTSSENVKWYKCWAGRAHGYLDASGMLYACSSHFKKGLGVNISEKGFRAAWKVLPLPKNCRSCVSPSGVEKNLVFSLNSKTVLGWLNQLHKVGLSTVKS